MRASGGFVLLLAMALVSCAGQRPENLGVRKARLAPCPSSPNCVSSDADDEGHRVEPLTLAVPAAEAWRAAREAVGELPRTEIIAESDGYLHAECRSRLFGFVDDLELHLRPDEEVIAVRSASRVGYGDMGVNRGRVEKLRTMLRERGTVQ